MGVESDPGLQATQPQPHQDIPLDEGDADAQAIDRDIAESMQTVGLRPSFGDPLGATRSLDPPRPAPSFAAPKPRRYAAATPTVLERQGAPRAFHTLEDLYSAYEIGEGAACIIVERTRPTRGRTGQAKGFLDRLWKQISIEGIRERWGGGTYTVKVVGFKTPESEKRVTLGVMTGIECAGEPKLEPYQQGGYGDDENMSYADHMAARHPNVAIHRMKLDAEERRRQDQRFEREVERQRKLMEENARAQTDPDVLALITNTAEQRVQETRQAQADTLSVIQRESSRLNALLEQERMRFEAERRSYEDQVRQLQQSVYEAKAENLRHFNNVESARIRDIEATMTDRLQSAKDQHAQRMQELQTDHQRRIDELSTRWERERAEMLRSHRDELNRMSSENERSERTIRDAAERDERVMRDSYERQIADLKDAHAREIRSFEANHRMQIDTLRTTTDSTQQMSRESMQMQLNLTQSQLTQAQASRDQLMAEVAELRAQVHKPPVEAITAARDLLDAVGGGAAAAEPAEDWKQTMAGVFRGAVDKLPDMVEAISQTRQQNQAARVQAEQQRRAMAVQHQHNRQMAAARARPAPAPQPPVAPVPVQQAIQPPPGMAVPLGSEGSGDASAAAVSVHSFVAPPSGEVMSSPFADATEEIKPPPGVAVDLDPAPIQQQALQQPALPQQPFPVQAPPEMQQAANQLQGQPMVSAADIPEGVFVEFVEELEEAVSGGVIKPRTFAWGLVKRLEDNEQAKQALTQIMQNTAPDQLADQLQVQAPGTAIASDKGRAFLTKLWPELQSQLAKGAEPALDSGQ